jgi:serine/threonine-protein kinase
LVGRSVEGAFFARRRARQLPTGANIAAIYDVGAEGDIAWFAMELVEGRTLRARLADGPSEVADALRIARGIARALVRAHAVGIVHRDLKPDNVMVDEHGEVKVLDFGLAKRANDPVEAESRGEISEASSDLRTEDGRLLGTPAYMSPEQANGVAVTPRSDVFSFGTMLYEMLAGERPFGGGTTAETLLAIERVEPKPPSAANDAVPHELDALVAGCLAKNPAERPASDELEAALTSLIADVAAAGSPSGRYSKRGVARRRVDAQASLSEIQPTPSGMIGAPVSSPKRVGRLRRVAVVATLAALGIALVALSSRTRSPTIASEAAALSHDAGEATTTEIPMPASSVPAALDAYRTAVTLRRNGTGWGRADLERAIALDPELTEAHLELAIRLLVDNTLSVKGRASYREAFAHPERLTPDRRDLMQAIEPLGLRDPADWKETARRLEVLTERYPQSQQIWRLWAASTGNVDVHKSLAAWDRVIEIAPEAPGPHGNHAEVLSYAGRYDEARDELDACIARSSQTVKCLWERMKLARYEGQCERMEEVGRQFLVVEPNLELSYAMLAESLAGRQPTSAVRAVLAQRWPTLDERERAAAEAADTSNADALDGDLISALGHARDAKKLITSSPLRRDHALAARREALLLLELGRQEEARAVAKDYAERRQAWSGEALIEDMRLAADSTPTLLAIAGGMAFAHERARWEADAHAQAGGGFAPHVWLNARALPAWIVGTRAEAEDAVAALSRVDGLPTYMPDSLGAFRSAPHTCVRTVRMTRSSGWSARRVRVGRSRAPSSTCGRSICSARRERRRATSPLRAPPTRR